MMIPPHAARLAGAWAEQTTRRAPDVAQVRRDRARRISVARVFHPVHRPQPAAGSARVGAQNPLTAKPARPA
jgi:hypothetical protein